MKTSVKGIKGRKQIYHAVYDFSVDGGVKDIPIDIFDLKANTIVHDAFLEVENAVVGTVSTLSLGVTGVDTDGIFMKIPEATLVVDYVSKEQDKGAFLYAEDDTKGHKFAKKFTTDTVISALIETANLTAGKVHFYLECSDGY